MKMHDPRQPIRKPADKNLLYLLEFAALVKEWKGQTKLSLTQQTTTAVHQTCTALVELVKYMLIEREFKYVLMADSKHSSEILRAHCRQDHSFDTIFYQISKKIFNMITRNYISQLKDAVRQVKRPNGGGKFAIQTRKITKLTANVV